MTGEDRPAWAAIPTGMVMAPLQIENLLIVYAHCTGLFEEVRPQLLYGVFGSEAERPYLLFITALGSAKDAVGNGPILAVLHGHLQALHLSSPGRFPGYIYYKAVEMAEIARCADPRVMVDLEPWARSETARLLSERKVVDPLRRRLSEARGGFILDPSSMLADSAAALASIQALKGSRAVGVVPDGWHMDVPERTQTGDTFIDRILGGGTQAGKMYGVLGPSGAFKTGLGTQLCVSAAVSQYARARHDPSHRPGLAVYAVYEGGKDEIQLRAMSCAAEIPKDRLERFYTGRFPLGNRPGEADYEAAYGFKMPESERLVMASQTTRHMRILDMAGPKENPACGTGYVDELAGALSNLVRTTGQPLACVVVDYAKLMARRHLMASKAKDDRMLRHLIGTLPDRLRIAVADQFRCPIWILQQLNTEANKKAAGAVQHHAYASEAGDFAENLWFAFVLSSVDKANGSTVTLHASKTRDTAGLKPIEVLRIDGVRNRLVPAEDYAYDPQTRRIVSRTALSAVADIDMPDLPSDT